MKSISILNWPSKSWNLSDVIFGKLTNETVTIWTISLIDTIIYSTGITDWRELQMEIIRLEIK